MSPAANNRHASPARRGFTLLELLIVIVIIAILASLLTVAVSSARRGARIAQVRTEIGGLDSALAEFKNQFGEYPPSRITLFETGTDWGGSGTEAARSRAIMRRFFPSFRPYSGSTSLINVDWNRDGDNGANNDTVELRGPECLVFFLAGMSLWTDSDSDSAISPGEIRFVGFSKNPANPFDTSGTNRLRPSSFEFNASRVVASALNNKIPVYLDPLPGQVRPYLYASSNEGAGYDRNPGSSGNPANSANRDISTNGLTGVQSTDRIATFEYLQNATSGPAWKDRTYQIISPGFDGLYGQGGLWNENSADTDLVGNRDAERDNITNFHNTLLAPN